MKPKRLPFLNTEGATMVIAGAGSGKTRVLTFRIAHMIKNNVDPFNILALTFTNKAAREMKERIGQIIGSSEAKNLTMGTFHSVFARILRYHGDKLGYPSNFTIYDTQDSRSLIKTIIKELKLDDKTYKPNLVAGRISSAKNNLISAAAYEANFRYCCRRSHEWENRGCLKFTRRMRNAVLWLVQWILTIYYSKQMFCCAIMKMYSTITNTSLNTF